MQLQDDRVNNFEAAKRDEVWGETMTCETNLDPTDLTYRCDEPAELVALGGNLGTVQTWMCQECQILFRAHGYSVMPIRRTTKLMN